MELDAILAVVLGGTSMNGGKFNLGGSCVGAIILMALTQTMFFYGVPVEFALSIKAIVIVIIVIVQSPTTQKFVSSQFKVFNRGEGAL
jgi:simple sugar transport system permease protein